MTPKPPLEYLYGHQPVLAALRSTARQIKQLLLYDNGLRNTSNATQDEVRRLADSRNIRVQFTTKMQLNALSQHRPHQNMALQVQTLELEEIKKPIRENALLLYRVGDPQNLGSIIRSAAYFGLSRLLLSTECAALSPIVSKASAGALEYYCSRMARVKRIHEFLEHASAAGIRVLATGHFPKKSIFPIARLKEEQPNLIIFGNEGAGLPPSLVERSEASLLIPADPQALQQGLDSLNVGVAAAVVLSSLA